MNSRVDQARWAEQVYIVANFHLFNGKLPENISIAFHYKKTESGLFLPASQELKGKRKNDELSFGDHILLFEPEGFMPIFVHQMVHCWQHYHGMKKPLKHYHNLEFANKMYSIGLLTESEDGKMTGYAVDQTVIPNGKFDQMITDYHSEFVPPVTSTNNSGYSVRSSKSNKHLYECPTCGDKSWGKPGKQEVCSVCAKAMGLLPVTGSPWKTEYAPGSR